MQPADMYPSTFDCKPILGAQEDGVLECILGAMRRYEAGGDRGSYITHGGRVCAVGAVYAEAGCTPGDVVGWGLGEELYRHLESALADEAKEAIALLNEAAVELHPASENAESWQGPLEWLNQSWRPEGWTQDNESFPTIALSPLVKIEVLRVYRFAADKRARGV